MILDHIPRFFEVEGATGGRSADDRKDVDGGLVWYLIAGKSGHPPDFSRVLCSPLLSSCMSV